MAKMSVRDRERALRVQIKESEGRNIGLVQYIQALEVGLREVFKIAAKQHESMRLVLPGTKAPKNALGEICRTALPYVQDVEDMNLSPVHIAQIVAEGGELAPVMGAKLQGKESDDEGSMEAE